MIYIIVTTSVNNKFGVHNDVHRQNRYIESITQLLKLINNDINIKPIIVENNGFRHTYLDNLKCDIFYTDNNINYKNKAHTELVDIKDVINRYNIKDDDIIIKITGRYKLLNSHFINLVKNNEYDAYVKFFNVCTLTYRFDDCVLGLFAIKCKYLKDFKYNFVRSPECEFADYVRKKIYNIMEVDQLYLECCFADNLRILNV